MPKFQISVKMFKMWILLYINKNNSNLKNYIKFFNANLGAVIAKFSFRFGKKHVSSVPRILIVPIDASIQCEHIKFPDRHLLQWVTRPNNVRLWIRFEYTMFFTLWLLEPQSNFLQTHHLLNLQAELVFIYKFAHMANNVCLVS